MRTVPTIAILTSACLFVSLMAYPVDARGPGDFIETKIIIAQFGTLSKCQENGLLREEHDFKDIAARIKKDADNFGVSVEDRDFSWTTGRASFESSQNKQNLCDWTENNLVGEDSFYPPEPKPAPKIERSPID